MVSAPWWCVIIICRKARSNAGPPAASSCVISSAVIMPGAASASAPPPPMPGMPPMGAAAGAAVGADWPHSASMPRSCAISGICSAEIWLATACTGRDAPCAGASAAIATACWWCGIISVANRTSASS